jgi:hypothetical protein
MTYAKASMGRRRGLAGCAFIGGLVGALLKMPKDNCPCESLGAAGLLYY